VFEQLCIKRSLDSRFHSSAAFVFICIRPFHLIPSVRDPNSGTEHPVLIKLAVITVVIACGWNWALEQLTSMTQDILLSLSALGSI